MIQHQKLLDLRKENIITTPEYMIFYNYFFRNFTKFLVENNCSVKRARELWTSGMKKIMHYEIEKIKNIK